MAGVGVATTVDDDARTLVATLSDATAVTSVVRSLDDAGVTLDRLDVSSPSLDDVFLSITGVGSDDLPTETDLAA